MKFSERLKVGMQIGVIASFIIMIFACTSSSDMVGRISDPGNGSVNDGTAGEGASQNMPVDSIEDFSTIPGESFAYEP